MPEFSPEVLNSLVPFLLMGIVFYFMLYRPQKREQQKRDKLLSGLKKGDRVITVGGIYGTITAITEKTVTLKVAEKVEIDFSKSAVSTYQTEKNNQNK